MNAEFRINGKSAVGTVNVAKLVESVVSGACYATVLTVVTDKETFNLDVKDIDFNSDIAKGDLFCYADVSLNLGDEERTISSVSLGEVVTVTDLSERVSKETNVCFNFVLTPNFADVYPIAGDNDFIKALLGIKALGRVSCIAEDFRFGDFPCYRSVKIQPGTTALRAVLEPEGEALKIYCNLKSDNPELIVLNDNVPVLRSLAKNKATDSISVSGSFNSSGAYYISDDILKVNNVSVNSAAADDLVIVPLLREISYGFKFSDLKNATVKGEPTCRFVGVKSDGKVRLYEGGSAFPRLVKSVPCNGDFSVCSDGTIAVINDNISVYFADGTEQSYDLSGEEALIVSDGSGYHLAVKKGQCLIRFSIDGVSKSLELLSIVGGNDKIGLFRASYDEIGYRDGNVVTVATVNSLRKFDYVFSGSPDSFDCISDCGYYSEGGACGNYRFGTEFTLKADFIGGDGLACVDGALYSLANEPILLGDGITSAARLGDYVITAESDAVHLYYGIFEGAYVLSEKSAGKAFSMVYEKKKKPFENADRGQITFNFG